MTQMAQPSRGEVWLADLNPIRGHEQAGTRPVLVVSADALNRSRAAIVFVVPLTTREKGIPSHVRMTPPEGGLSVASFAMCEHLRSISTDRLVARWGEAHEETLTEVADRLRMLLDV